MPAQQMEVRDHASLLVVVHLATHCKGDWGSFSGLLQATDIPLTVKGGRVAVNIQWFSTSCSDAHWTLHSPSHDYIQWWICIIYVIFDYKHMFSSM